MPSGSAIKNEPQKAGVPADGRPPVFLWRKTLPLYNVREGPLHRFFLLSPSFFSPGLRRRAGRRFCRCTHAAGRAAHSPFRTDSPSAGLGVPAGTGKNRPCAAAGAVPRRTGRFPVPAPTGACGPNRPDSAPAAPLTGAAPAGRSALRQKPSGFLFAFSGGICYNSAY